MASRAHTTGPSAAANDLLAAERARKRTTHAAAPPAPQYLPPPVIPWAGSAAADDRVALPEGAAVLYRPATLSLESIDYLEAWFQLVLSQMRRQASE